MRQNRSLRVRISYQSERLLQEVFIIGSIIGIKLSSEILRVFNSNVEGAARVCCCFVLKVHSIVTVCAVVEVHFLHVVVCVMVVVSILRRVYALRVLTDHFNEFAAAKLKVEEFVVLEDLWVKGVSEFEGAVYVALEDGASDSLRGVRENLQSSTDRRDYV